MLPEVRLREPVKLRAKILYDLGSDVSDEARFQLLRSDEATGRVSNAQVLDPALEVSLVDWTLEVAAGPVKARWVYLNAAAGGTLRPHQRRARAYARWAGLDFASGSLAI